MSKLTPQQEFALKLGYCMGALTTPDIRKFLTDNGVSDEDIEAASTALAKIAAAFYRN